MKTPGSDQIFLDTKVNLLSYLNYSHPPWGGVKPASKGDSREDVVAKQGATAKVPA